MLLTTIYLIVYSISISSIFTICALVFLRRKSSEYRSFAAFGALLGLWLLLQFLAQVVYPFWISIANQLVDDALAVSTFMSVLLFIFAAFYVHRSPKLIWHFIAPVVFAILDMIPGFVITKIQIDPTGIAIDVSALYYVQLLIIAAYIGLAIKLLAGYAYTRTGSSQRARSRLLLYATVQLTAILVIAIALPGVLISQLLGLLSPLVMVIIVAYAMLRHRLFDIKLTVIRALAYFLSLLALAILYTLLTYLVLGIVLRNSSVTAQQIGSLGLALVLAITFSPLKKIFDRLTRQIFYRSAYDTPTVIDSINSVITRTVRVNTLLTSCLSILNQALRPTFIGIVLGGRGGKSDIRVTSIGSVPENLEKIAIKIPHMRESIAFRDDTLDTDARISLQKIFQDPSIAVVAKLVTSDGYIGFLVLGDKVNGAVYNSNDANLIHIVNDIVSVAIQNALRYEEIERFNEKLRQEIDDATAKLRTTNKKLRALDEAKDEFISIASHQLRTPLTSVKGHLSMLIEGDAGRLKPQQQELAKDTFISAERMAFLITDLLNISRLKDGKLSVDLSEANLPQMIREEIDQFSIPIKARQLSVRAQIPTNFPLVHLDIGKIRQVIMNFIDNAIYYSKPGGKIIVSLVELDKQFALTVQDNGIGIPANEQAHIFSKFFRASNARYVRPDGTGIGLFAASKIIAAHGGTMIFESKENRGSTFGFRLPLK